MLKNDGMDSISRFSIITILSMLILLPFSLWFEGWKLTPAALIASVRVEGGEEGLGRRSGGAGK